MCDPITHKKEMDCLKHTIETILKSIEIGEKKLRKIFKNGPNNNTTDKRSASKN